jgi:hypothetical protein
MKAQLLRRQFLYLLRRLRWQGVGGLLLTLTALTFGATLLLRFNARIDQVDRQIAQVTSQLQVAARNPTAGLPTTPAEQLEAFYQAFPASASVPDWLARIYALADEQQLVLEAGDYVLNHAESGRLDKFTVILPVRGSYPQLRRFIRAALLTAPALALERIDLKRDNVAQGNAEARIVFLLFLEKAP